MTPDKTPFVDCITFGSPCQDLSVAGNRAGLDGERSGLFMDAVKVIKGMRGKSNELYPTFAVWENVPGAFSSNKGEDFRTVLEELARICEAGVVIPRPQKGKWKKSGFIVGDRWSIAWRTLDAKYWGVPQRRKRIALVLDLRGQRAGEILFERTGVSGHLEPGIPPWKGVARNPASSAAGYDRMVEREVKASGAHAVCCKGNGEAFINSVTHTSLSAGGGLPGQGYPCVMTENPKARTLKIRSGCEGRETKGHHKSKTYGFPLMFRAENTREYEEMATTLCSGTRPGFCNGLIYSVGVDGYNGDLTGDKSITLRAGKSDQDHVGCIAVYCRAHGQANAETFANCSPTLSCNHEQPIVFESHSQDARYTQQENTSPACTAQWGTGGNNMPLVAEHLIVKLPQWIVRRLIPVECERLQGYPDGWTDIGEWYDEKGKKHKPTDGPRYKAMGNSIALPQWWWLFCKMAKYLPKKPTLGSLFDGVGGFPLVWETRFGEGTAIWASEIEPFPVAVTKLRFPEKNQTNV